MYNMLPRASAVDILFVLFCFEYVKTDARLTARFPQHMPVNGDFTFFFCFPIDTAVNNHYIKHHGKPVKFINTSVFNLYN